jgi:hypothetical protein
MTRLVLTITILLVAGGILVYRAGWYIFAVCAEYSLDAARLAVGAWYCMLLMTVVWLGYEIVLLAVPVVEATLSTITDVANAFTWQP